jgi:hypothetical protein
MLYAPYLKKETSDLKNSDCHFIFFQEFAKQSLFVSNIFQSEADLEFYHFKI